MAPWNRRRSLKSAKKKQERPAVYSAAGQHGGSQQEDRGLDLFCASHLCYKSTTVEVSEHHQRVPQEQTEKSLNNLCLLVLLKLMMKMTGPLTASTSSRIFHEGMVLWKQVMFTT
ncbi:hypothetical protein XENOCAPTIV_020622 [Xenoophorus captivus]|uniref:Uncharacterized protein n=1 Tax=Xenoophorus captivus TaxID=1517983 RepID=A0ABV0QW95_9TELE